MVIITTTILWSPKGSSSWSSIQPESYEEKKEKNLEADTDHPAHHPVVAPHEDIFKVRLCRPAVVPVDKSEAD